MFCRGIFIGSHSPPPLVAFSGPLISIRAVWSLVGFNMLCDMKKGDVKLVVFNGGDFVYWKNRTHNYLLSQGHSI
jgi:hypothetical protein